MSYVLIVVEGSYEGPRLEGEITPDFMKDMMAWFKDQKKLHRKYAFQIILGVKRIVTSLPSLVDVSIPDVS